MGIVYLSIALRKNNHAPRFSGILCQYPIMNLLFRALALLALVLASITGHAGTAPSSCDALREAGAANVQILETQRVKSGVAPKDPMAALTGAAVAEVDLPAHCLVRGIIEKRLGADGKPYGIRFEMRLPEDWQRRLLFQGGGGLDGFVATALGRVPVMNASAKPALARGYAVVSMDGGHQDLDGSFAQDQQARIDFAYAAIGKVWREAQRISAQYYGQPPAYRYFMGCSNGGREAMIAAQRYPTEFDGVVAGNPGFHLSCAAISESWDTQTFMRIAPKDLQGRPLLSQALSPSDLKLVSDGVIRACDGLDGVEDGIVNNYSACHFDPQVLQCSGEKQASCLSAEQVNALRLVFGGPKTSAGQPLYSNWPFDAGVGDDGWRAWKLGFSADASKPDAYNVILGAGALKRYFMTPADDNFDVQAFNFDRDPARVAQTGALNDAISTYLTTFEARGGKLLIYHGLSDPAFSATDIMRWYDELQRDTDGGDAERTRQWARLFMVPGMTHCGGGPALNDFDPLAAMEAWVEHKQAPDSMPATGQSFPGKTQPLCPYPKYAKYIGGNVNALQSYSCASPN